MVNSCWKNLLTEPKFWIDHNLGALTREVFIQVLPTIEGHHDKKRVSRNHTKEMKTTVRTLQEPTRQLSQLGSSRKFNHRVFSRRNDTGKMLDCAAGDLVTTWQKTRGTLLTPALVNRSNCSRNIKSKSHAKPTGELTNRRIQPRSS